MGKTDKKIFLVKPNNLGDHIQVSLGLGYLATSLRKSGYGDVSIIDGIKSNMDNKGFASLIKKDKPHCVGFQCYTYDLVVVRDLLEIVKKEDPDCLTLLGGPHPSSVPRETLEYFAGLLDFAFAGEAEIGLPKLMRALNDGVDSKGNTDIFGDIPGLVWRGEENQVFANAPIFFENIDELGEPAWDLLKPETYPEAQHGAFFDKFPISPIFTTRGCPFNCTFCAAHKLTGKKVRTHSVEYVLSQIKKLYHERGIREVHIIDDNFTFNKDFAKEVLKGISDLKLDLSLATPNGVRLETLDEELLDLFKEAGLYHISVAIESGSNRILKKMKKGATIEKMMEKVRLIREKGIPMSGFFIIGFPTETREEILDTIKVSKQLGFLRANYFTYLPFPGTASYYELAQSGEIDSIDWKHFYFMSAPYTPKGMTRKELLKLKNMAFLSFYLRPAILISNLLQIKGARHFMFLLKRFYHWILMARG